MADFTVSLSELRRLKKKLEDSEKQLEEALRRMLETGPKNLGKRSLDKACEDFHDDWEHGLKETKKRLKTLNEALPAIIKAYEETEDGIQEGFKKAGGKK
ncbi:MULTISPECIES: hypothetical protein [Streptomyces]|uniref:Uncharacterized protein n=2 Tax=Streptomyces rimosus subsp. rimosus TaxID=132474 RepID=L8EIW2_STRR1|nr:MULTISPECIES: hypothetical protein [Streptomyces]KOG54365.1 hypothetical protein ADK76_24060 [Streptomyces griseoflavus]KOG68616.1 hypothetical protein ADK78_35960 [Kitasatospora aureofaciens]MYT45603.1 hypothetical protein [Streptomyces sp. SID5471]KEF04948.1 hypothetical protein DF17_20480 [Streptomyces rimosus]KEF21894.1 hypothetical protein DF18_00680 [Streptomyces rimosus]